ncbi:putative peptidase [Paenibacillus cisolokensis]|uniref:Peptidase n=1 Tax=Paenibacillus cisolokensis TaxID=1658519 RepID=A0ABQ4N0S1_9BACL|nr:CocE/NonD family hydrolase [Paenibacillus cisolokensis]GIQ61778.1 putative peptidase [Paenibacillus cisolokensis]
MSRFGGVVVRRAVPCVMRDGVKLYSDIYMPDERGEFPVLLMRQPYGRTIASTVTYAHPVWYARHGYIVVIQDVRGRGDSEGEFAPFIQEGADGFDTVEWAAALPQSNGRVGMYGFSYQGITQWAAAAERPPSLKAIAPAMCPADLYHGTFYPHGSFAIGDKLPWAFQLARDTARRAGDAEAAEQCTRMMRHPDDWLFHVPVTDRHPLLERYFPTYYEWCEHTEYDGYWRERNWLPRLAECPIPALHIGGWYDSYLMGTLGSFAALQESPGRERTIHRLIVGPWGHIPWGRMAGGADHGPAADGDIHMEQLRWFDYWLKGNADADPSAEPPVRYFEQYSNSWRTARRWPAADAPDTGKSGFRLYLSGTPKPANGALGGGVLAPSPGREEEETADVFVYDARLPMRTDNCLPSDRSAIQDRYEILVYSGEPLDRTIHLFGSPKLVVRCQTMGGPTDLVATLTVVKPDGKARFLSVGRTEIGRPAAQGAAAAGAADGDMADDAEPAAEASAGSAGEWERAAIDMRPFAAALEAGDALRLELTGSAFPLFARHPNAGPEGRHRAGEEKLGIVAVAVCRDNGGAAYVELPVAPLDDDAVGG